MCRRIHKRFIENSKGFWNSFRWWIIIFLAALLSDCISTSMSMLKYGAEYELHPVILFVSKITGPILGPLFAFIGKSVCAMAVAIYLRRFARHILILATAISLLGAWYNFSNL